MILDLNAMLAGYLECALWTSTDEHGEPLDGEYFPTDISAECQGKAREDCTDFARDAAAAGVDLGTLGRSSVSHGYDLWLTRNGHGAGFWDRGYGPAGDVLSDIAKGMGSRDAYVGDDARVYLS